jgi:antitoxin ParD1/3/4
MNINLTSHFESFIEEQLISGRYANASEVVREALRLLEEKQQLYEAKLRDLRTALDEGDNSPVVPLDREKILARLESRWTKNQSRGRHV